MIRRWCSARAVFTLNSLIVSLVFCSVSSPIPAAAACDPVVYLLRHAEEKPGGSTSNTLLRVGQQHAELYPSMIEGFQGNNCPVSWVYAMSSYSANGSIGTSNPYYTAYPSADALPQKTPQNTIGRRKLLEFLPNEEQAFVADIETRLIDDLAAPHSVAIFWSSQGMCKVAETLGSNLPSNYDCEASKPPRNSVYVFKYDSSNRSFARAGNYIQCFNFNPAITGSLEDKFSFDLSMGFPAGFVPAQYYCQAAGNLADDGDPAYKSVFGTTGDKATKTPAANGSITAVELSALLRGQICDLNNLQDNCHL
jgi:hypothetical protein